MSGKNISVTIIIFSLCAAGIALFAFRPFSENKPLERYRTRVIVPTTADTFDPDAALADDRVPVDSYSIKSPLNDGEFVVSILNLDFDNDSIEEQIVAYRSMVDAENHVSIAYFGYDERSRAYERLWNVPVTATVPGTISMYSNDLIGDRSPCIIVTGINAQGEHTMTVFRKDPEKDREQPFITIANIRIGGSIDIQETERPLAYQQGIARGQPFVITASGRNTESDNMLDRIEITYMFNTARGIYEQSRITRVPGSQIEERRVREILTGQAKVFEEFIYDLWYHVSPQGTIDRSQYLYFDPANREIIFFGDETQQVFYWLNSSSTRYGIYISSQNISVTTMRRFVDVEMGSLESIRIRVNEDVKLKIGLSEPWDGLYRRAGTVKTAEQKAVSPYTNAVYDSSMGRLRFYTNGEYELSSGASLTRGSYAFFNVGSQELLELRPTQQTTPVLSAANSDNRFVYKFVTGENGEDDNISLSRVRLGSTGIHELHEAPISLTKVQ